MSHLFSKCFLLFLLILFNLVFMENSIDDNCLIISLGNIGKIFYGSSNLGSTTNIVEKGFINMVIPIKTF